MTEHEKNEHSFFVVYRATLRHAIDNCHIDIIKSVINYLDSETINRALLYATKINNTEIVKLLISKGANVRYCGKSQKTALEYAKQNKNKEIIRIIQSIKLLEAIKEQDEEEVKILVASKEVDVNHDKNILIEALKGKDKEITFNIINWLLEAGIEYDSCIDNLWCNAPPKIRKLLEEKWKKITPTTYYIPSRGSIPIEKYVVNPDQCNVEQIGGYGNHRFPAMGWGNKGTADDEQ